VTVGLIAFFYASFHSGYKEKITSTESLIGVTNFVYDVVLYCWNKSNKRRSVSSPPPPQVVNLYLMHQHQKKHWYAILIQTVTKGREGERERERENKALVILMQNHLKQ
jgi:hypothetical protein